MREAAERRQQLELEHEQALAVLNAKQQEIDLLQKAQVEAKKEHEGAVQLLEEKCRTQSEQFNLLSKELEKFRLQAGKFDLFSANPLAVCDTPGSPSKSLAQLLNGLATPIGKGNESPANRSVISEFIRPIQITGDKPELLSVKPTFLTRTRPSSPRRTYLAEMDNELSSTTSKVRYTGKVRLCIARYSYNPYDGPNENPEAELPLVAGKYLYVYGTMDEDGFYEGELLDGQRGLVPSNFVDFVQDEEMPSIHTVDSSKDQGYLNHTGLGLQGGSGIITDSKYDGNMAGDVINSCNNGTGTLDVSIDEIGEDIVPYPRKINLIKQLAKSVIVGWEPPVVPPGWGSINGYNVLVDKEVRMSVPFGGRTKSLIEKLNLATCTYRISIQSITERGLSDDLRCTLLVGKDVVVAPFHLRVDNITQISAELSWLPSNSNYSHMIFLNDVEYDVVKAASYKYQFFNLKPNMVYKVKAVAQPHQMPWQLPLEQRERREVTVEFCTQPAGPPFPPQEVLVQCGTAPGVIQVRWKPPALTATGTSNGANVVGYAVCTKGQKIAEVLYPTADYVTVELNRLQCLEAREVIVRTLSAQGDSQDSPVAVIPHNLLMEKRNIFSERSNAIHPLNSDEEEDGYESPHMKRRGASVDEFLRGSELGRQVKIPSLNTVKYLTRSMRRLSPSSGTGDRFCSPHRALCKRNHSDEEDWDLLRETSPQKQLRSKKLFSIPEVAEEDFDPGEMTQRLRLEEGSRIFRRNPNEFRCSAQERCRTSTKVYTQDVRKQYFLSPTKCSVLQKQRSARGVDNCPAFEDRVCSRLSRQTTRSPDSGLDCGSEEEEARSLGYRNHCHISPLRAAQGLNVSNSTCDMGPERRVSLQSTGRKRTLTRQSIVEEDFCDEIFGPYFPDMHEAVMRILFLCFKILGNPSSTGRSDRLDHSGRRLSHGCAAQQRPRPMMVPSIDGYGGRERHSPEYYEESEPEDMSRIFVALFDYDPLSMSPNPDAADEELPFKEGQIIKVYGDKDTDGFYRGEICGRAGLIPCNMVSEIQTDDEDMMEQLIKQGFLPLNTPVEKIERNRRSGRQHSVSTRRMVALYDYDPRESSPNVDVEAELTFCAGDIITVFGEIDEDGFYYGEINGHKGLVPSNFLEEVPDDVEVYLTDTPSRYAQDTPVRTKTKRVQLLSQHYPSSIHVPFL
ncbi:RIMB2 protein, partial [Amia calva]|nr:RIMB2 protein [Amia calva]